jgi:hypothetical protein
MIAETCWVLACALSKWMVSNSVQISLSLVWFVSSFRSNEQPGPARGRLGLARIPRITFRALVLTDSDSYVPGIMIYHQQLAVEANIANRFDPQLSTHFKITYHNRSYKCTASGILYRAGTETYCLKFSFYYLQLTLVRIICRRKTACQLLVSSDMNGSTAKIHCFRTKAKSILIVIDLLVQTLLIF